MPDEETQVETTETTETVEQPQTTETLTAEELHKALAEAQRSLKNKSEEATRVHAKLQRFEAAEEERRKAELSEIERLKLDLEQAQTKARQAELSALKREIADKTGLPAALALRLTGETPEALEADAKALLEALPKKTAPNINPTNPGTTTQGETREERNRRLGLAR